jgi:hypothetical protein
MLLVGAIVGILASAVLLLLGLVWGDRALTIAGAVAAVAFGAGVVLLGGGP